MRQVRFLILHLSFIGILCSAVRAQTADSISGVILDDVNEPLIGAVVTITEKDSLISSHVTDIDGKFAIELPEKIDDRTHINVSYSSYSSKKIKISTIKKRPVTITMDLKSKGIIFIVHFQYKIPLIDPYEPTKKSLFSHDIEKMPR